MGRNELLMKESIFMRVLFCKIHCPFVCFCKPSAAQLYTSGPLKLEDKPHVVPLTADAVSNEPSREKRVNEKQEADGVLKSCIRKSPTGSNATENFEKKRVQWMDEFGKELYDIKEFESSETGDEYEAESRSHCVCVIL